MNKVVTPEYISIKNPEYTVLWGNKFFNIDKYTKENNIASTGFCEQFHSDIMLESTVGPGPRCDAIYTNKKNHALVIKTADCVPVLVKHQDYIIALHAGWRGVCDEILLKLNKFSPDSTTRAYIGPHIGKSSYEVDSDVINKIINKNKNLQSIESEFAIPKQDKYLLDLNMLAQLQLAQVGIHKENIYTETIDTLTDLNWNSYRRDHVNAGRNLSLIIQH